MNIEILAVGQLRRGPMLDLFEHYSKQMVWPVRVKELKDHDKLSKNLNLQAHRFVLDERGEDMSSQAFAGTLRSLQDDGMRDVQFVIGPADGLDDEVRKSAHKLMSFGKQTWPHMMVRVMLIEQIYRAQQIIKGHPYHRD